MSDTTMDQEIFQVVHPLDDVSEKKLYHPGLGRMKLTPKVRIGLFLLQGYLAGMLMLVGWKVIAGM